MAGPCSLPVVSQLCSVGSSVAGGVADDFIQTAATDAANAANSILQTLVTAWTAVPTQLGARQAGAATSLIQGDLLGIEVWVGVLGVIVGAARMALFHRGEPFRQVVSGLLNMIVIGGAGVVAINLLATAGDNFSNYLLSNGFGQANSAFDLGLAAVSAPFLLLILAILAIVSLLVQVALIILRSALLVVLAGVWPVAAAASMTSAARVVQEAQRLDRGVLVVQAGGCNLLRRRLPAPVRHGRRGDLGHWANRRRGLDNPGYPHAPRPAALRRTVGVVGRGDIDRRGAGDRGALAAGAAAVEATAGAAAPAAGAAGGMATGSAAAAAPSGSTLAAASAPATNGSAAAGMRDAAQGLGEAARTVTDHAEDSIAGEGQEIG